MRIATSTAYDRGTSAILRENADLNKTLLQIATGKRILSPADDPADSARVLGLTQQKELTEKYQDNIIATKINLEISDATLEGVVSALQRIREITIQANNDTYDADQRKALSYEVKQVADGLISSANQVNGQGEYLFAGYRNDTMPFVTGANGEVSYQGSQDRKNIQIGASRQIPVSDSGYEVFMDIPGATGFRYNTLDKDIEPTNISLFKVVSDLEETLRTNESPSVITDSGFENSPETFHDSMERAINNIDASLKHIVDIQSTMGARHNATESQRNINADFLVQVQTSMSDSQDLDYATAVSDMKLQQMGLQAAQQSFTKIQSLNLFNFI
ncbi:MAG: flagellar hook-associated protein FlgL [Gammaproteobacteria bacterium]|nr:flagellar hook-associated protein FlgL [Gammaproteobacteria bacterium]